PARLVSHGTRVFAHCGSQAPRRINRAMTGCVQALLMEYPDLQVTHQCGTLDSEHVAAVAHALPPSLRSRYTVEAFFDDIGARMAAAALVVMRAGCSSLAECPALRRLMILVPAPYPGGHLARYVSPLLAVR